MIVNNGGRSSSLKMTLVLLFLYAPTLVSGQAVQLKLYPSTQSSTKGSHSTDQPISVLATNELSGTFDGWNTYREMIPNSVQYSGYLWFQLPPQYSSTSFSDAALKANIRGPKYATQKWSFHIRNVANSSWQLLLDNSLATDWVWSQISKSILISQIGNYLDTQQRVQVRLMSSNAVDVLDLDFLELALTGSAPPQASPSASPSESPVAAPSSSPIVSPSGSPSKSPVSGGTCDAPEGILIPLYIWPTISNIGPNGELDCSDPAWLKVGNSASASKTVAVVNPQNGPPNQADSWQVLSYQLCITFLKSKGVTVVGYVHTKIGYSTGTITGYRNIADVKNDISSWHTAFSNIFVDGIFVDEVSNVWPDPAFDSEQTIVTFNQALISHVFSLWTAPSARVVLNPGSPYFVSLMEPYFGDERVIAVVRETDQSGYSTSCEAGRVPGPWCKYSSLNADVEALKAKMDNGSILPKQSAVLIYSSYSTGFLTNANIQYGVDAKVGYHYFVDHAPWSTFPSDVVWVTETSSIASAGCSNEPSSSPVISPSSAPSSSPISRPVVLPTAIKPLETFTYDLPGVQTSYTTKVVFIDMEDTSAAKITKLKAEGRTVICYFSAGSYEDWRSDKNLFTAAALGNNLDGWAGERWLDIRRSDVLVIMQSRMNRALEKGCHGVDPDNVDGYQNNSGFPLTSADQTAYLRNLATYAHSKGLLIGLKNSPGLASTLQPSFDFSVVEECNVYNECSMYYPFSNNNKAVFAIEYRSFSSKLCQTFKTWKFTLIFANYALSSIKYCP